MSETSDIHSLVLASLAQPGFHTLPDGRTFAAIPKGPNAGYELREVTADNAVAEIKPTRVCEHVNIQSTTSMVEYVNRFKNADSVMFANINANQIDAVIDYHKQPEANAGNPIPEGVNPGRDPSPDFGGHRATLTLPFSQEWDTWVGNSEKLMPHVDFATFLEENSIDIITPAGGDLLEVCRDLQVKSGFNFNSSIRQGDVVSFEIQKGDDVSTKDNIELPTSVTISIPVYFGEPNVTMIAFMRRKIVDGRLYLGFKLSRYEQARQADFKRIVSAMASQVEITTLYGSN